LRGRLRRRERFARAHAAHDHREQGRQREGEDQLLAQTIRPIERALRDGGELDLPLLLRSFSRISSRTAG